MFCVKITLYTVFSVFDKPRLLQKGKKKGKKKGKEHILSLPLI